MSKYMHSSIQRVVRNVQDLFFPPTCLGCDASIDTVDGEISLCSECVDQLKQIEWPVCPRCSERVPEYEGQVLDCGRCRHDKLRFDRAIAWGQYEGLLGELIVKMKYDRSERLGRLFSQLILRDMRAQLLECQFDAVLGIPMHPWRRFSRGVNPAAVMARIIAKDLGVDYYGRVLGRRNFSSQKDLSRLARFRNMKNVMSARAGYYLESFRVLLVDDILTTGATCSEAARVLKKAGAAEVTVLVVGRTQTN